MPKKNTQTSSQILLWYNNVSFSSCFAYYFNDNFAIFTSLAPEFAQNSLQIEFDQKKNTKLTWIGR